MKVSFEEIKKVTFGAVRVEQKDEGIHFYKCTEAQIKAWYNLPEGLGERSEATTGITLDFYTDSTSGIFEVCGGKFEVAINGTLTEQYLFDDGEFHEIKIDMPEKKNRITLYFPSHTVGKLKELRLDDNAAIEPYTFDCKMLFLGDSITQGWDAKFDSHSYAYLTAEGFNAERVINGIGGAFYHPTTFDQPDFDPDIVIVAYGTNDFGYNSNLGELKKNVSEYLHKVKETYAEKLILVVIPVWRFGSLERNMGHFDECRNSIQEVAKSYGLQTIDGYKLIPHFKEFYADDVHPNDLGFGAYARNLVTEIRKFMQ